MQNLSLDKQLLILLNEALDKRRLFAFTFSIISIVILVIGLNWPKLYESSTTLIWNQGNMLKPLAGTAAANAGSEQAQLAKEVIYSNKNLEILIEKTGLDYSPTGEQLSDRDIEYLKTQLRGKLLLKPSKNNTLKISYKHTNPELAFLVVNVISQLFIEESSSKKKSESIEAYNFIEKRVNEYELKLEKITSRIDEFKSENIELQIDTTKSVNARVGKLKEQIRVTSLKLKEAIVSKESLTAQLEIESAKGTIVEEENANNERLLDLEYKLNT